jgi:hypothetical protein
LNNVRDNTLGIRRDEAEAFYRLLAQARDVPADALADAARPGIVYTHLMVEPERYRGELVTLAGEIRRINEFPAGPNRDGLERLFEAWMFTADSGTHPLRIVLTRLPRGVRPATEMSLSARVTGYFFKREGYNTPAGLHVAPVLLAQRIQPIRDSGPPPTFSLTPYLLGLVLAVGAGLAFTLWTFRRSDRPLDRGRWRELAGPGEQISELPPLEAVSVEESLRQLAERDAHAD